MFVAYKIAAKNTRTSTSPHDVLSVFMFLFICVYDEVRNVVNVCRSVGRKFLASLLVPIDNDTAFIVMQ